jgi:cell division septation protein DedD
MKKIVIAIAAIFAIGAAAAIAQDQKPADAQMPAKQEAPAMHKEHHMMPPMHCELMKMLKDATVKVTNTDSGVTVEITAKDADSAKKLQEVMAKHVKDGKFDCPCMKMFKGKHDAKGMKECPMDKKGEADKAAAPADAPAAK